MNKETLEALRASIAHHEAQLLAEKPYDVSLHADDCALCDLFRSVERGADLDCIGCPIAGPNQAHKYCAGTPFNAAWKAWAKWVDGDGTRKAFLIAQQAEIDFLKSLLPTGEA